MHTCPSLSSRDGLRYRLANEFRVVTVTKDASARPLPLDAWEKPHLQILYDTLNLMDVKTNGTLKRKLNALDPSKPAIVFSFPDLSQCNPTDFACHRNPDDRQGYLDTHTIFMGSISAATTQPWEDGFRWTIVHEIGHVLDYESGGGYAGAMRVRAGFYLWMCEEKVWGPTWYGSSNPENVYDKHRSEDFSDSLALYVLGKNNSFFNMRQAIGQEVNNVDVKDGRPGIPWRMEFIKSLF